MNSGLKTKPKISHLAAVTYCCLASLFVGVLTILFATPLTLSLNKQLFDLSNNVNTELNIRLLFRFILISYIFVACNFKVLYSITSEKEYSKKLFPIYWCYLVLAIIVLPLLFISPRYISDINNIYISLIFIPYLLLKCSYIFFHYWLRRNNKASRISFIWYIVTILMNLAIFITWVSLSMIFVNSIGEGKTWITSDLYLQIREIFHQREGSQIQETVYNFFPILMVFLSLSIALVISNIIYLNDHFKNMKLQDNKLIVAGMFSILFALLIWGLYVTILKSPNYQIFDYDEAKIFAIWISTNLILNIVILTTLLILIHRRFWFKIQPLFKDIILFTAVVIQWSLLVLFVLQNSNNTLVKINFIITFFSSLILFSILLGNMYLENQKSDFMQRFILILLILMGLFFWMNYFYQANLNENLNIAFYPFWTNQLILIIFSLICLLFLIIKISMTIYLAAYGQIIRRKEAKNEEKAKR